MGWVWGVSYRDHWLRADLSPRQPPRLIRQQRQDAFGLRQDMLALLEHAVLIISVWRGHPILGSSRCQRRTPVWTGRVLSMLAVQLQSWIQDELLTVKLSG